MALSANIQNIASTYSTSPVQAPKKYNPSIFDKLSTNIKNSRDVNDTVTVPRCIFKGYLCFMLGTTSSSIASLAKNHLKKAGKYLSPVLNTLAVGLSAYGTYNFVKPYLFKNSK